MAVRSFLSTISPVIAREPAVFVEALANTCNVEEASGSMGTGRPIVVLKPKVCLCSLPYMLHVWPQWSDASLKGTGSAPVFLACIGRLGSGRWVR